MRRALPALLGAAMLLGVLPAAPATAAAPPVRCVDATANQLAPLTRSMDRMHAAINALQAYLIKAPAAQRSTCRTMLARLNRMHRGMHLELLESSSPSKDNLR